ncbi:MAG: DUF4184 family protein [Verrucomicrobiota bacterium]|nr:DUF4184 family protein [Verrucomicrobiota bacterium]
MPWTVSHPALVLPLQRFSPRPFDFAALILGSMTPDMGYYVNNFKLATFAHTLPGSFIACVPLGVLLMVVFYLFCKPLCYALPAPHRQALLPLCPAFPATVRRWAVILPSLLLGAWSHNFWDAFTHEHGWFVERIPWLMQPVMQLTPINVRVYLVLQEMSTVLGFAIVVIAYWRWLRRQPAPRADESQSEAWRYFFWLAIAGASLLFGYPAAAAYANSVSAHGFLFLRSILFRTAVYAPQIAVPLTLVATAIIYAQRKRSPAGPHVL